jgi:hypothetical protein
VIRTCATVTHDHDATNLGVNDVQDECQLHLLLTNDSCEGEDGAGLACDWQGQGGQGRGESVKGGSIMVIIA